MKAYCYSFCFIILFIHFAFSQSISLAEKIRIAVLDFNGTQLPRTVRQACTDLIRNEMIKTGLFTVLEREEIDVILEDMGLSLIACEDQSCAVKVGKSLSAKKVLVGEINKLEIR